MTTKAYDRRRRLVRAFAPAVGLLAAGLLVWQGSYAAFSATTQNNSDVWTAGTLALQNNGGGGSYAGTTTGTFGGSPIKPGDTATACLTVKSTGDLAGTMRMYVSSLADSTPSLGDQIVVTIDEANVATDVTSNCSGFPASPTNVVTSTALTALPTTYAGAASAADVSVASGTYLEAYRLTWTFQSTGTTAGDNALQGSAVTAGFTWELQ